MYESIRGMSVLIVDASRGIGCRITEAYMENDASVVVAARSVGDPEAIASGYSDCYAVECDLRYQKSIKRAVEKATDKLGCLEVVVNSAGILTRGPPHEASESDLNLVVNVNLLRALRLIKRFVPELMDADRSCVNISSEAGSRGVQDLSAYSSSKGGLNTLIKQLAVEYGSENVNVHAIASRTTKHQ